LGRAGGLAEQVPDAAGEVALEAAQRFAAALALGLLAREVGGRLGVRMSGSSWNFDGDSRLTIRR
jgi:hypothetical protein